MFQVIYGRQGGGTLWRGRNAFAVAIKSRRNEGRVYLLDGTLRIFLTLILP